MLSKTEKMYSEKVINGLAAHFRSPYGPRQKWPTPVAAGVCSLLPEHGNNTLEPHSVVTWLTTDMFLPTTNSLSNFSALHSLFEPFNITQRTTSKIDYLLYLRIRTLKTRD